MQDYATDPAYLEALEWFVLMKDEEIGDAQRTAFEEWLAADPSHVAAYDRARALWDRFEIVKPEYDRLHRAGRIGRRSALLGGLAMLVAAPAFYMLTRPGAFADYSTGAAERITVRLPDGSTVELGSYSALSLDFTPEQRRLVLHRGQAFFRVAAEPSRPFVVQADGGTIQALGTEFDVKVATDQIVVTVIEHSVKIQAAHCPPVVLEAGWQLSYGSDGMRSPVRADLAAVEAWRQDRIIVEDVPLRQVLTELERYRQGRIVLMDSALGDIPVTAVFNTRHTDKALQVIAETLPVQVLNAYGYLAFVYPK
ncbi:FecR family protein [Ancylobacter sp. SL191]|uniref:FecR family protein n=1 Tax=Ancylobacter sp. SL191 TaxID=2995166 RepID=UPI002271BB69|nr:FecR family protein [Ancylobacter sp. SL191]WAC27544.1 FecR family protein [Ancylobacter sp. SL191]